MADNSLNRIQESIVREVVMDLGEGCDSCGWRDPEEAIGKIKGMLLMSDRLNEQQKISVVPSFNSLGC